MSEERRKGTKLEKEEWEKTGGKEKRKRGKKGTIGWQLLC